VQVDQGWRFPVVAESRLDNGMRLLFYHCPGQFVIASTVVFDVPLTVEPRAAEGVGTMAGRLVARGCGDRTAEQFTDALALCGADFEVVATVDAVCARMESPAGALPAALGLMAEAVQVPTIASEEFDNEQRLRLDEIEQEKAYPGAVASKALSAAVFPPSARRSRPTGGTSDTVGAMTRDDVAEYVRAHLGPERATIVLAGDLGTLDAQELANHAFGSWSNPDQRESAGQAPERPEGRAQVVIVDQPAAPQSTLRVAGPAIPRSDPRWAALFVANYCIGGSFGSRINTVLREQKGFTYGSDTSIQATRHGGLFLASTAVRSDATSEALADIVDILRAARGSLRADEVERGVAAASESMALGFERASAVAARAELLVTADLPLDHVDTNLAALRAVTVKSADAAYREIVDPESLTVVVVGDEATHREPIERWGYAPLAVPG
jgi:predicted Zn-dependent peptidase